LHGLFSGPGKRLTGSVLSSASAAQTSFKESASAPGGTVGLLLARAPVQITTATVYETGQGQPAFSVLHSLPHTPHLMKPAKTCGHRVHQAGMVAITGRCSTSGTKVSLAT